MESLKSNNVNSWDNFFDDKVKLNKDDLSYMNERPMNNIPIKKDIFLEKQTNFNNSKNYEQQKNKNSPTS